ncbi:ATP-binding protein [Methylobacter sp. G7]|uniref:ATP-binding protein n=1 Tax=Methylobacter sp. G7 TaxID=3230117 RepID=UPI003D80A1C2
MHLKAEILGLQRTETYEIPIPAIREALVNAVLHRDYSNFGRDIKVGIYDDLLNIVSPSGLPNGLMESDLREGRSEIRNRVLARVFKELNYIEQWGSGISRIKKLCKEAGNPEPKIQERGDFVDWELYRSTISNTEPVTGSEKMSEKMSEKIVRFIQANPNITIDELSKLVEVSTRTIERNLKSLQAQNRIKRIGPAKGGYWEVME